MTFYFTWIIFSLIPYLLLVRLVILVYVGIVLVIWVNIHDIVSWELDELVRLNWQLLLLFNQFQRKHIILWCTHILVISRNGNFLGEMVNVFKLVHFFLHRHFFFSHCFDFVIIILGSFCFSWPIIENFFILFCIIHFLLLHFEMSKLVFYFIVLNYLFIHVH